MGESAESPGLLCRFLSGGRGAREDQGELRVPQVSHPAGRGSAEDHEWDLQEWLQRQHHASQGDQLGKMEASGLSSGTLAAKNVVKIPLLV